MKKRKVVHKKTKKRTVRHVKKYYSLVEGNSNEFLLIVGASFIVIATVIYFIM